jgi:hypothetical protein
MDPNNIEKISTLQLEAGSVSEKSLNPKLSETLQENAESTNVGSDEDTIGLSAAEKTIPKEAEDLSEGWRNPGWLSVISLFLVNFAIFGIIFTWGIFQNV